MWQGPESAKSGPWPTASKKARTLAIEPQGKSFSHQPEKAWIQILP